MAYSLTASICLQTTLATAVAVANPTPKSIDYPSLDITKSAEQASKPSYADSTTIIVDKDEAWEAEYLKAMEQAVRSCSKRFDVTYANSVLDEDEKRVYVGQEEV
jgi:hypothetical protein